MRKIVGSARSRDGLLALLAVGIMLLILFAGEEIGLSDNGDFGRVLNGSSLQKLEGNDGFVYVEQYRILLTDGGLAENLGRILFSAEGIRDYPGIQLLLVRLTVAGNLLVNAALGRELSIYRLRSLGILYTLLYGWALFTLFRRVRLQGPVRDTVAKLLMILVLCDVGYVTYFNSFYGEPLQMIGLILLAACGWGLLAEDGISMKTVAGLCCGAVLYGGGKLVNIPLGILFLGVFGWIAWQKLKNPLAPVLCGVSAVLLLAVLAAVPGWMSYDTDFNAVFYGVTRDVDRATAEEYLSDLGLDASMADFADNHAYVEGVQTRFAEAGYREQFQEKIGKAALLRFYLTHPGCFLEKLRFSVKNSGMIRPYYLSNFDSGHPRYTLSSRFSVWSALRQRLGFDTVAGALALLAGSLLALGLSLRDGPRYGWLVWGAVLCAWGYQLVTPYVTNGEGDIAKHMFAFAQISDLMFLGILLWACSGARRQMAFRAAVAGACLLCLAADPALRYGRGVMLTHQNADTMQAGAYVQLGSFNGSPMTWLVAGADGDTVELLCTETVTRACFSPDNGNLWRDSSLRAWLNAEFLQAFSPAERALLTTKSHPVLLSAAYRDQAADGERDFGCSHLAEFVGCGADRAYQRTDTDTVTLADVTMIMSLFRAGYDISGNVYWLTTPYFNNGSMVRCVYPDGNIYFQDAAEPRGVRPVVYLRAEQAKARICGGTGSQVDPFRLETE